MNLNRREIIIAGGAVAGAAALAFWYIQRRHVTQGRTPDWTDPRQPVEGTGGQPTTGFPATPSPMASWYAVRPGTARLCAQSNIRRTYAATLVDDPESLVR